MPVFPQVGGMELLILLFIILLFFGARRIPELGRSLGSGMREFRKKASEGFDAAKLDEQERNEELPPKEEACSTVSKEASLREEVGSRREAPPTKRANVNVDSRAACGASFGLRRSKRLIEVSLKSQELQAAQGGRGGFVGDCRLSATVLAPYRCEIIIL